MGLSVGLSVGLRMSLSVLFYFTLHRPGSRSYSAHTCTCTSSRPSERDEVVRMGESEVGGGPGSEDGEDGEDGKDGGDGGIGQEGGIDG